MPTILFFNVNGSGMGHLNRCLAYARRVADRARPVFFSLASAIEIIEGMGFEADYFVSHFWSGNSTFAWNSELAVRLGLMLERVRPVAVVFDGPWPYQGFAAALQAYGGSPALVWSNRGLLKTGARAPTVDEKIFDLVLQPGELGVAGVESTTKDAQKRVLVPPVCLLDDAELLDRTAARSALGLPTKGRQVLFSLGPGNLKDVAGIGHGLIRAFETEGFEVSWARPPISVRDVALPSGVRPLSVYPLVRYLRAFDAFVGAAGYNTCCEVVQAGIPTLLVPNEQLTDDQSRRAHRVAGITPAVVSACETTEQQRVAVTELLGLMEQGDCTDVRISIPMNGATRAAEEILALCQGAAS